VNTPSLKDLRLQRARHRNALPWWVWTLAAAAGLVGLYAAFGFWIAPGLAKTQLEKRLSDQLRRPVSIQRVQINPFRISIAVNGLTAKDRDGQPFVAWQRVFVNFDLASVFSQELVFQEISVDGLQGRLAVSKDGRLNCEDLFAGSAKPTGDRRAVRIDRLAVADARIDYMDASGPEPFSTQAGPVSFFLRNFRTSGKSDAPGVFTAAAESGETLAWRGAFALSPLRSNGEISLGRIGLRKYAPYYGGALPCEVRDGVLDVRVRYDFWIEKGRPALRFTDGNLALQSFKVAARGASEVPVAFDRITIQGVTGNTAAGVLDLPSVVISGGHVVIRKEKNGFNLASLFPPPRAASTAPKMAGEAPLDVRVGEFSARELTVDFEDKAAAQPVRLVFNPVSLSAKKFSTKEIGTPRPVEFMAKLASGGSARVNGLVAFSPLNGAVAIDLAQVPLAIFGPYMIPSAKGFRIASGLLNASGQINLRAAADNAEITAQLQSSLDEVRVVDAKGSDVLQVKNIGITGLEYSSRPAHITLAELSLTDPSGRFVVEAARTPVSTPVPAKEAKAAPLTLSGKSRPTAAASQAIPSGDAVFVAIDKVSVSNGSLSFTDLSVQPKVEVTLGELEGALSGVSSSDLARADVDLRGKLNGGAPIAVKGQITPFDVGSFTDLKAELRNADLAAIGPYVSKYVGYRLAQGSLTVDARMKSSQRRINSNVSLTVQHLEFGEPTNSPEATRVPLTLALALLRDPSGKIALTLPVQGSLEDPDFRVGPLVGHALENILVKIATSPFAFIASRFGGGYKGEELGYEEFQPGGVLLESANEKKLQLVARQMRDAPDLRMQIEGGYDAKADLEVLRQEELDRRVRLAIWKWESRLNPSMPPPEEMVLAPEAVNQVLADMYRQLHTQPKPAPGRKAKAPTPPLWSLSRWFKRSEPKPSAGAGPAMAAPPIPVPPPDRLRREVLDSIVIDDAILRQLATSRADIVREYLVTRGDVPRERIGLAAPSPAGARVNLRLK
jgi:hypothetical protein